jgi:hemerythrin
MAQKNMAWGRLAQSGEGLSHAELVRAANEVLKKALIQDKQSASESDIRSMLAERIAMAERFKHRC